MTEQAVTSLQRLETADLALTKLVSQIDGGNLTPPDPSTGEQWDLGQIWAHMVEFIPFWQAQAIKVLDSGSEPVQFGRPLTHEGRVLAIERNRKEETAVLHARLQIHLTNLRHFIQTLSPSDWETAGEHLAMGTMTVAQIVNRFLIGHLESHVQQLTKLLTNKE
ncbi:MAG: hypothetical protein AAF614_20435 [Chloroflexota bacterium]